MGYTHYFHDTGHPPTPEQIQAITRAFRRLLTERASAQEKSLICHECDEPDRPPIVDDALIRFNGKGRDGHDTMVLDMSGATRSTTLEFNLKGFNYCKTAGKPYDVWVTALLALMEALAPGCWKIYSDGYPEDWTAGVELARRVVPHADVPHKVVVEASTDT